MPGFSEPFHELRRFALSYPETREDHPWGETAIKVRGKVFLFLFLAEDGALHVTLKLTERLEFALEYPFARPSGYGLGKSGWVSCTFKGKTKPPLNVLHAWIDESFRAVATKKMQAPLSLARSEKGGTGPARGIARRKK